MQIIFNNEEQKNNFITGLIDLECPDNFGFKKVNFPCDTRCEKCWNFLNEICIVNKDIIKAQIIFDNELQRNDFFKQLYTNCPEDLGLPESEICHLVACKECWESVVEYIVKGD